MVKIFISISIYSLTLLIGIFSDWFASLVKYQKAKKKSFRFNVSDCWRWPLSQISNSVKQRLARPFPPTINGIAAQMSIWNPLWRDSIFSTVWSSGAWMMDLGGSYYLLWLWVCIRAHKIWEYWAEFFFIWLDKSCGLQSPLHWNSQHNFYEDKRCDNFQAGASMRKGCLKMHPTEKYCNAKESLHWKKIFLMKSFIKGRRNKGKMPEDPIP